MKQLVHELSIDATPADVWSVLVDVDRYGEIFPTVGRVEAFSEEPFRLHSGWREIYEPDGDGRCCVIDNWVLELEPGRRFLLWNHSWRPAPDRLPSPIAPDDPDRRPAFRVEQEVTLIPLEDVGTVVQIGHRLQFLDLRRRLKHRAVSREFYEQAHGGEDCPVLLALRSWVEGRSQRQLD